MKIFNLSAKLIHTKPQKTLCELQEVKLLRHVDHIVKDKESITIVQHTATHEDSDLKLLEGIDFDDTDLTTEQKQSVKKMFQKWECIFSRGPTDIGHTNLVEHHITLDNEQPFKEPHRKIPPALFEEIREHLNEMLSTGAIRDSESPYSSNVVIVRKPDGSIRFCVDYRKLNNRTVKDAYAIPRIEDTLHLLAGSKYFSKLDLRSGYWQVEMKEEDKKKTAFQVGTLGFYEFNRMPVRSRQQPQVEDIEV